MTAAILISAILGITLFGVVMTLLSGAIRGGNVDRGAAIVSLRRQMHEHRRTRTATATAHRRAGWTPSADAS